MRLDERLLDEALEPVARRYVWDPPAVSLGKFQRLPGETAGGDWAADAWEAGRTARPPVGLDLVRRPTGGRAVLHGAGFEWSFALVFPLGVLGSPSLQASYRFVNDAFANALGRGGVAPDPAREVPYQRSGLCFATALRHDLLVGGEKVVAVAQARRGANVLIHGSVLERRPPVALVAELERLVGEPWRGEGLARHGLWRRCRRPLGRRDLVPGRGPRRPGSQSHTPRGGVARVKLVVLGGGPAGYVAALRAAQLGAQSVVVEAREIGGTCLNRGCIPTKALVAGVERLRQAREAPTFGVEVGEVSVDFAALMRRKDEVVAHERAGVEHLLKARKVEVVAGRGRLVGPRRVRVEPIAGGGDAGLGEPLEVEGDALVLASGSEPLRLPLFDFSDPRVYTSDEILGIDRVPDSMLIVGGGVIGCEFASVFAALGARVTIVEMLEQLLPGEDKRTGQTLRQAFKRTGIELRLKTRVEEVLSSDERGITVRLSDGEELTSAVALVSVGRQAVSAGLGYQETGVSLDRGFVARRRHPAHGSRRHLRRRRSGRAAPARALGLSAKAPSRPRTP